MSGRYHSVQYGIATILQIGHWKTIFKMQKLDLFAPTSLGNAVLKTIFKENSLWRREQRVSSHITTHNSELNRDTTLDNFANISALRHLILPIPTTSKSTGLLKTILCLVWWSAIQSKYLHLCQSHLTLPISAQDCYKTSTSYVHHIQLLLDRSINHAIQTVTDVQPSWSMGKNYVIIIITQMYQSLLPIYSCFPNL